MTKSRKVIDPRGRVWTVAKVRWEETEEKDFRFWYEGLTPEERVDTVAAALESCLKTRGRNGIPRLRRVHRRIERPWGTLPSRRRPRQRIVLKHGRLTTMPVRPKHKRQFAICIRTDDPDLLTPRRIYEVLPDESAA